MGCSTTNCDDEGKLEAEQDEASSSWDLPVKLIQEDIQIHQKNEEDGEESKATKTDEDFNFGSLRGSLSTEPEMCAADEVFFQGQILPLRLSVSSASGLTWCHEDSLSRSESMDHGSLSRFTSSSSSFNSIPNGSSSYYKSKPVKTRNNFNTHPTPKPHIRSSKAHRPVNISRQNPKSSMWDFFRLGLVRAPELELVDLKARSNNNNNGNKNSVSRNNSWNSYSSNDSSSTKNSTTKIVNKSSEVVKNPQDFYKGFMGKRIGSLSGCKCSVNAAETVPLNGIAVSKHCNKIDSMENEKKLLQELKIKKKRKEKLAFSCNRTFEWLTELSHGSYVHGASKKDA
ncbi:putative Late embryoproteinsis abundant protein group 8 protein [Hibiscus syriacus]|uniref:Late embryoproteinsis abundant protein group 8 protein n=1 Tax=Hibiscus syriacus TaxID=106335 RepID=A0A6A2XBF4_HIBSY|nr:uncharacterized protein LOC120171810 [Hibiscus syriacus]KAE8672582.1 putative Late embryoproteinsis abundant protein group 8 protein [Hibiscus syriacus]